MKQLNDFPLKFILPFIAVFLLLIILIIFIQRPRQISFTPEILSESTSVLNNPYQGFYHIIGYTLTDDYVQTENLSDYHTRGYDSPLVLLEINLKNYRDGAVSDPGLTQLEDIFKAWSESDTQIILRFLYDWDGIAKATEPKSLSTILTHMDQVSEIVNRYASSIYLMQGIFVGSWGEMHDSYFMDEQSVKTLLSHLHEVIAPSIYLSVRTPAQWRMVTGLYDVPAKFPAFQEHPSMIGRLGLYNDGMLGSLSDLGTYGDTPRKEATFPSYKGIREDELSFQNTLCQYVPNGGEVVCNNPYNDLPSAVQDLRTMHISYLNADYDSTVLEKWRQTIWDARDAFSGCDGLTYVKAHLGYRYTVRQFTLRKRDLLHPRLTIHLTLENTGFGNTLKPFEAAVLFRHTTTGETIRLPLLFDFRNLKSGQTKTLTASLPVKDLTPGTYELFFSVTDTATGRQIALANTPGSKVNGLLLGRLDY